MCATSQDNSMVEYYYAKVTVVGSIPIHAPKTTRIEYLRNFFK